MQILVPAHLTNLNEKQLYILGVLLFQRILNNYSQDEFVPVKSEYLQKILGSSYKSNLDSLLKDVMETDNFYIKGEKSKGYKFINKVENSDLIQYEITDKYILRNISKNHDDLLEHHLYLKSCLEEIEIESKFALKHLETLKTNQDWIQGLKQNHSERISKAISKGKFIKKRIEKELIKSALENYKMQIRFINEKIFELSRDSKVFRIHTNVTRLSRELRPFLKYKSQNLHEIDISNSQMLFLYVIINDFYNKEKESYINPYDNTQDNEVLFNDVEKELQLFRVLVESGKIYDYIMENINYQYSRDKFKKDFFKQVLFDSEKRNYKLKGHFKKLFPFISQAIKEIKKSDYTNLPIQLQIAESQLMVESVVPRLMDKGIFTITIHDSVMTTEKNIGIVEQTILDEFEKQYQLRPKIKIKGA